MNAAEQVVPIWATQAFADRLTFRHEDDGSRTVTIQMDELMIRALATTYGPNVMGMLIRDMYRGDADLWDEDKWQAFLQCDEEGK